MIFSREKLRTAWKNIYLSKPVKAREFSKGVDGISVKDFRKEESKNLAEIYDSLERDVFVFSKLKSFFKQRGKGKKPREIQVPTVADRIVQKVLNDYLAQTYFTELFSSSNVVGSVKGNNVRKILKQVLAYYNDGFIYVLKTDIIDYFPSIKPDRLRRKISYYIKDDECKKLINNYLEQNNSTGIPQGPPLSPLMANVYLLSIDKYLASRKKIRHLRYVDDVLVFCRTKNEAYKVYKYLLKQLASLDLEIHPLGKASKTKIALFDSGEIDALGVVYKQGELLIKKGKLIDFIHENIDPLNKVATLREYLGASYKEKIENMTNNLNYKLHGWGNAYSFCNVSTLFMKLDENIVQKISVLCGKVGIRNDLTQRYLVQRILKLSRIKMKTIA